MVGPYEILPWSINMVDVKSQYRGIIAKFGHILCRVPARKKQKNSAEGGSITQCFTFRLTLQFPILILHLVSPVSI